MDRTVPDDRRREGNRINGEWDMVKEAIARAQLPEHFQGDVTLQEEEYFVEIDVLMVEGVPTVDVRVDAEEVNGEVVPAGEYPDAADSAAALLNTVEKTVEEWGLERDG